jgi:hypothetical protein
MTLLERDILAVALSLNTVFMILILPNVVPINYDLGQAPVYVTTLLCGAPLGALGVWLNHWAARQMQRSESAEKRR